MKLTFILAFLATLLSANIINNNTTNHNNLEFINNNNTTVIPAIEINTTTAGHEITKPPITSNKTTNKMILKCNRFGHEAFINHYTDIWKKGFKLKEYQPPRVETHIFTDKKRFENSRCCSVVELSSNFYFVVYRGLLLDISVYNDVSRRGESVTFYNGIIRSKGKNANTICVKRFGMDSSLYAINCCKTLNPESLTGCNFFNLKILPYNTLHGRCLMLVESDLSIPGSTDMIYKRDDTVNRINTPFATTDTPSVSTNKNFIIKVVLITSGLIITSIIVVICYKKLTKKKTHVILKEDEEEYL